MSKNLYFLAALAIVVAACTNEEKVYTKPSPKDITFKAVTQKATRGALAGSTLPTLTSLYITAYHEGDDEPGDPFHEYFHNMEFTYNGEHYVSATSAVYPDEGHLEFIAYTTSNYDNTGGTSDFDAQNRVYPSDVKVTADKSQKHINKLSLEYGNNLVGQTDVMYSELLHIDAENPTVVNGVNILKLRHALALLKVNFRAAETEHDNVLIKDVVVKDAYFSGTINVDMQKIETGGATALPGTNTYNYVVSATPCNNTGETMPFKEYASGILDIANAVKTDLEGLLVLPQTQKVISFKFCRKQDAAANFDPTQKYDDKVPGYSDWEEYEIVPTAGEVWKDGNRYHYDITISAGKQIKFSCQVTPWEHGSTENPVVDPTELK